jgi:hypothetical protein
MSRHSNHEMLLRIESVGGSPINDYRIKGDHVEVRSLAASGYPHEESEWRALDDNDIRLHHALRTVVSTWLRRRMGRSLSALGKAA